MVLSDINRLSGCANGITARDHSLKSDDIEVYFLSGYRGVHLWA